MSRPLAAAAGALTFALAAFSAQAAEPVETYVVRKGDTLYEFGRLYLVRASDYRTVARLNGVRDPRRLKVGTTLKVPARMLRTRQVEAKVAGFRGAVTATVGGRTIALTRGAVVTEGAIIATGPNAFLRLDLPDGTALSIPSQSRIRLGRMQAVEMTGVVRRELEVQHGRLESDVTPLQNDKDSYTVRTPMSVSAVRGTEFAVSYDEAENAARTEVIEGLVSVSQGPSSAAISASHGAVSSATGMSGPLPLPAAPKVLNAGRVQDEPAVRFTIEPAPVTAHQVRLATDAGFVDVLEETTTETNTVALEALPDGIYFLRLAAVGESGLVGMPATYAFERRLNTLDLAAPSTIREGGIRRYKFRWNVGGEGQRTYRLQLTADGAANPVVDESGLTMQELTVTDLPPGVYHWRVMSRTYARGSYAEKWSPPERFEIGR